MKEVLLDTNIILTCIKQKIDFFEDLESKGFKILIPKQVIQEIEKLIKSKQKLRFREDAKLALKLLDKENFKKINIGKGHVDKRIKLYADEHPEILIATLDKELQDKLRNSKIVIREKKRLEVI